MNASSSARARVWAAIAAGLALAMLGPLMGAVASQSGSSGTGTGAEARRGAWVTWSTYSHPDDLTSVRTERKVAVWQQGWAEAPAGAPGADGGLHGASSASIQTCTRRDVDDGEGTITIGDWVCGPQTLWRGTADRLAPPTDDDVFTQDPSLRLATYQGLVTESGGDVCHVAVTVQRSRTSGGEPEIEGAGWRRVARVDDASVTTDCWGPFEGDVAIEGEIWQAGTLRP